MKTGQYAGETLQVYNYVGPLYGGTLKEGQGVTLIISTYSGGMHTARGCSSITARCRC